MSDPTYPEQEGIADWYEDVVKRSFSTSEGHLDLAVVTYGSLLHPEEIEALFHIDDQLIEPIRVKNFARRFSKSVAEHLRDVKGSQSGVLNVHPEPDHSFNGLLIGPLSEKGLRKYAFREREYDVKFLDPNRLDFYTEPQWNLDRFEGIFTCYWNPSDDTIPNYEPVPDYLDLCLEGAQQWGEEFLEEFKKTTLVGERDLNQYLK